MKINIIDAKRTPIGKFLGSFYECNPVEVCKQVITNMNINLKDVELSIFGNAIPAGLGQGISRNISISSGIPQTSPSYVVNMVCGSGMQAVINGFNEISLGKDLVLTGGFEFMSNIPYATDTYIRLGKKFGDFKMADLMTHDGLIDSFSGVHMGVTAENIAKNLNISRREQDEYSCLSQSRSLESIKNNYFNDEIITIDLLDYKKNKFSISKDEFPNPKTNIDILSALKPAFIKDGTGTVTAGNSSGINDGAAFIALASDDYCKKNNIKSEISIVGYSAIGCDPQMMGLGPYYAIKDILNKNNLSIKDIDVFEINEAFAAQVLGCFKLLEKEYNISEKDLKNKTNIHGSGIGLGHPLGCSGARIIVTLYHHMIKNNCKYGIASLCVGGGMGLAVLLKKE